MFVIAKLHNCRFSSPSNNNIDEDGGEGAVVKTSLILAISTIARVGACAYSLPASVKADANCDKAAYGDSEHARHGAIRGNTQHCLTDLGDNPEPWRSCHGENAEKDNDDDGNFGCVSRGQSPGENHD